MPDMPCPRGKKSHRWVGTVRSTLCFLLVVFSAASPAAPQGPDSVLRIIQLDVGQGDAALVITPENRRLLIDAGRSPDAVAYTLQQLGVDTLHFVVASHAHADHIGGMATILSSFPVQAYMDNGIPHTTATYRNTMLAVERSRAQYLSAVARTITLGSLTVRIMPPPSGQDGQNNTSVGLLLEFGEFRALYTGDSERRELAAWLKTERVPNVTLVKVPHHGARNGTTMEWILATRPRLAVISVGKNSYEHPAMEVEYGWTEVDARVYRTDYSGTIKITAARNGSVIVRTQAGTIDTIPGSLATTPP
jgi:competence protein ComEC